MKKLGNGQVDDMSMIRFIVNGIKGKRGPKTSLYEAQTLKELQQKLRVYQLTCPEQPKRNNGERRSHHDDKKGEQNVNKKTPKCFNCGNEGHKSTECPDKEKGKKCFNCGCFGHVATACRKPKAESGKETPKGKPISIIESTGEDDMIIPIEVKGRSSDALLDTGSPYTIMDLALYKQFKLRMCSSSKLSLKGFAGQVKHALGEVEVIVLIQNNTYKLLPDNSEWSDVISNGVRKEFAVTS